MCCVAFGGLGRRGEPGLVEETITRKKGCFHQHLTRLGSGMIRNNMISRGRKVNGWTTMA